MDFQWQYNHLAIPLGIAIVFNIILIGIALTRRKSSLVLAFLSFLVCALILTTTSLLEILTLNLELSLFFADISFIGITFITVTWLAIVMIYTGKEQLFKRILPALFIVPIATNIVIWTNSFHHLWRVNSYRDLTTTWFPISHYDYGIWFNTVHYAYALAFTIIPNIILLQSSSIRKNVYRTQIWTLLFVLNLPIIIEIFHRFEISPIPYFNASVLVFPISGMLLAWIILDFRFLDVTPIVRDLLIESMDDLMVVVDEEHRIRDVNPAAQKIIFDNRERIIGEYIHQLLSKEHGLAVYLNGNYSSRSDFVIKLPNHEEQIYELRISEVKNSSGEQAGRLLLMRDITMRKNAETAYYQQLKQVIVLEERQRIARDLHDSVNQTLFAAGTFADLLPMAIENKPERVPHYASEIQKIISGTSAQLRLILLELHPDALVNTELGKLLRQLCQAHADTTGTSIDMQIESQILLAEKSQIAFYRIAQEALHNINKHANATQLKVGLTKQNDHVELSISDNGNGFNTNNIPSQHFGVANMRQRAADINASLLIESKIDIGTVITLCQQIT